MTIKLFVVGALLLVAYGLIALLKKRHRTAYHPRIPLKSELPAGTDFLVKEFDVPIARIPGTSNSSYVNWYGGLPRPFDQRWLTVDNNWPSESFEEWCTLIQASIK
jgi:hypothetical protein